MELRPFDPAVYLDSEDAISAYLEEARRDGGEAEAVDVVRRARAMNQQRIRASSVTFRTEAEMATNTGEGYRNGSVQERSQYQHSNGDWQKRDDRTGRFMERKSSDGPFKGVAEEPDGRKA